MANATSSALNVALIGLGEVGQRLARDLRAAGVARIAAYDLLFADPSSAPLKAAQHDGLMIAGSARKAAEGADLVFAAVTAGQALEAAGATAPGLARNAFYVDLNSVSPKTKQQVGAVIDAAGGRFVEAAVMSPFPPKGIKTPMLLGGHHTEAFLALATPLGFSARLYRERIGGASSVKMCRSIMVKGIESLIAECLLASDHYAVTDDVLASLKDLFPGQDWNRTAGYMLSRTLEHGRRRAEEMAEVVKTVADAGLEPWMSQATVARQQWAGEIGTGLPDPGNETADRDRRIAEIKALMRARGLSRGTSSSR